MTYVNIVRELRQRAAEREDTAPDDYVAVPRYLLRAAADRIEATDPDMDFSSVIPEPPLRARATDPRTSHTGMPKRVRASEPVVLAAATKLAQPFTDSELAAQVAHDTGKQADRPVIARVRLQLEKKGWVERVAEAEPALQSKLTPAGWQAAQHG